MLHKCFAKEMVPKYGGLDDFSATILLTMNTKMYQHHCSLFKLVKNNFVIDRFAQTEVNRQKYVRTVTYINA